MDVRVFVIGYTGVALMPTTPRKARVLLASGRAKVYCKRPFTIKLLYKTGSTTQQTALGIDTGSQHIGIGVVAREGNTATPLYAAEAVLRSTMEKRKLLETRKEYRRGRRYRKTRYRKPKFRHHTKRVYSETLVKRKSTKHMTHWNKVPANFDTKPNGWLPPSVKSKADHHIAWIYRMLSVLPKSTWLGIELARFDMAHMLDPSVHGELYQQGLQYDYENTKAYVFARDDYRCQCCGAKAGTQRKDGTTVKLIVHHVLLRAEGATDNPRFLASVCDACHTARNHKPGGKLYQWYEDGKELRRGLRDATAMNALAKELKAAFPDAYFTFGNITAADRKKLRVDKSHAADAVTIAARNCEHLNGSCETVAFKQARKKKRSLHEATPRKGRKEPNREAKRNSKNTKSSGRFVICDKVAVDGQVGWISGFAGGGTAAYVKNRDGGYIPVAGKTYNGHVLSTVTLLRKNNGWLYWVQPNARIRSALSSPT